MNKIQVNQWNENLLTEISTEEFLVVLEFSQANKPLSQKVKTKRFIWFLRKSLKINAIIDKMYKNIKTSIIMMVYKEQLLAD